MPASRISAVVDVSSLSDDDIQQLIEQLMGKLNANSEWQAAVSAGRVSERGEGEDRNG